MRDQKDKEKKNKGRVSAVFSHQLDEESPLRSNEAESGASMRLNESEQSLS